MKEVDRIKLTTLSYWRFDRQHIAGAIECHGADVLTISRSLMIAETEVKLSISDMRREVKTKRSKHWRMKDMFSGNGRYYSRIDGVNYFYFVVPELIKDKAYDVVEELYPYAGLLVCRDGVKSLYGFWGEPANVYSTRPARKMNRPKPELKEILRIAYACSNTTIKYGEKLFINQQHDLEV